MSKVIMNINNKYVCYYCCAILLSFNHINAWALSTDAEKPIVIDSNSASYDDKTATSIYSGDVISIQGSIKVNSDKLTVYFINGEADKLVFTGNKAKFKQTN